jgi:hypothetical protein
MLDSDFTLLSFLGITIYVLMFMREIDSSPDGLQRTRPSHKHGGFFTGEGGRGKKKQNLGIPPMI